MLQFKYLKFKNSFFIVYKNEQKVRITFNISNQKSFKYFKNYLCSSFKESIPVITLLYLQ